MTRRARTTGLVAGLFLSAGILALMVLIVILIAIYKWGELNYGAFVGLELVAGVLIILTAHPRGGGSVDCQAAFENYAAGARCRSITRRCNPSGDTSRAGHNGCNTTGGSLRATGYQPSSAKAEDLIEPLFALFGRYMRWPQTGHLAIDNLLQKVGSRAQGTTDEAVTRAADLVRNGDRATMLSVLAAAALFGWLIGRRTAHDKSV